MGGSHTIDEDFEFKAGPTASVTQLQLYKNALSMRTGIPLNSIAAAAFNEAGYVEFG